MKHKSLVYGPVTSRRLGLSVGVDMVPYKVCSFDCIYCQIGRTAKTTVKRRDFGLSEKILQDLAARLENGIRVDHITLGGSGEPTLTLEMGKIIRGIRRMTQIPVAVLTNSSLLWDPDVQDEICAADIVLPSVDAADADTYRKMNRPHPDIPFDRFVEGIIEFSRVFEGEIWVEVFLVKDVNTSDSHLEKLKHLLGRIDPDRVHLNTAVRPPAEAYVSAIDPGEMEAMAVKIDHDAEVIAEYRETPRCRAERDLSEADLMDILLRRPCTVRDIAIALNADENRVAALVERLVSEGRIREKPSASGTHYLCTEEDGRVSG